MSGASSRSRAFAFAAALAIGLCAAGAQSPGGAQAWPDTFVSRLHAPLSEVDEVYQRGVLAFPVMAR